MTRRPERLKATELYGSENILEQPESSRENGEKLTLQNLSATRKKQPNPKSVIDHNDKEVVMSSNTQTASKVTQQPAHEAKQTSAGESSITITPRMTSTAIPKAPRINAKTNNKSNDKMDSLRILIMNANGKNDKGGTLAERRRQAIQNVVLKHKAKFVLFQEFSWIGITGETWEETPIPEHYVYKGHKEASMMYDGTCVNVEDIPASDIQTILTRLQSNANNRLNKTFPMDFNPVSRMCILKITTPTIPGLDFICISWHGISKMKKEEKIDYFKYWMEFLRHIREKYKLPILAGGDYNVDMYSIERYVRSPFKLCIYKASERRTENGIIDYCIVTEDLDFTDISWVDLTHDTSVINPNGILDHDPIVGSLALCQPLDLNKIASLT